MSLRAVLHSRLVLGLCLLLTIAVPIVTMPHLQRVSPWPLVLGLMPWVVGKYVLCPLRWQVLTRTAPQPLGRRWFLRTFAESELLGLLTPGHVGADVWRVHRLTAGGLSRGDALMSVGADRLVGGVGLAVFVAFAATTLPVRMLIVALGVGVVLLVAGLVLRRVRPGRTGSRSSSNNNGQATDNRSAWLQEEVVARSVCRLLRQRRGSGRAGRANA